ncbi:MAG: FtsX-like permease family protein [Candidatus Heimdallarchaeota archaeon]|nr:FtsX-like permease family protein [Candidatus Heimdallarchaeota archaeon]
MPKPLEHLKLNWKFIEFNKRLAAVTIIGLSISIAMITQNLFFLNSFRQNAFQEFAQSNANTYVESEMYHVGTYGQNIVPMIEASVNDVIQEVNMEEEKVFGQEWITFKFFYLLLFNNYFHENEFHNTYLIGIKENYLSSLANLISTGMTPQNGDFCIVTNSKTLNETNLAVNGLYEGYVPVDATENPWNAYSMGIPRAGTRFNFTSVINVDELSFESIPLSTELETLLSMILSLGGEVIITDIRTCIQTVHGIDFARNDLSIKGRIIFDLKSGAFNPFQLEEEITQIQVFINRLQENLIGIIQVFSSDYELSLESSIIPLLAGFKREFRIFQIFLLVFMLPTLGMSLALTSFAISQVKKRREVQIQTLHQRGASRQMLFGFMLFELVFYAILAVITGIIVGWPYTLVAMKSDGFFSFTRAADLPKLNSTIIWICVGVGFSIAFLSNIGAIWRRAKVSVEEALQEREEQPAFWERFYLDFFILISGTLMWFLSTSRISGGSETALEFAFYFAAPAPILLITGSIMLATRVYPFLVKGLSDVMFKMPKLEISAISARNAIRRKGSIARTVILMTITFTLTVSSMIAPDSYREFDREEAYYSLGTDIVVSDVDILTPTYKNQVQEIEGVKVASYVSVLELSNSESDLLYQIKILGVELDNFSKVAFQEEEYTNGRGISQLLGSINNITDVIGQKEQMELLSLGGNTTFIIKNWGLEGADVVEKSYPVNFVDYYQYWPTLYTQPPDPTSKELFVGLLANISLPLMIARYDYDVQGKLFVKVEEGYSISQVANEIETKTQHNVANVRDLLLISEGTLKATVLFGSLNSSFIMSLVISSATLIMLMLIQAMEREKELAVLKSMGISPRQLFMFFLTEALIILGFALLVGIALGFGTSTMLMKILRIGSIIPPHEMIFPITKIIWTTLAIFIAGLVSTIIPIIINSRKKIGRALKTV